MAGPCRNQRVALRRRRESITLFGNADIAVHLRQTEERDEVLKVVVAIGNDPVISFLVDPAFRQLPGGETAARMIR
jgi:hypothetical protein